MLSLKPLLKSQSPPRSDPTLPSSFISPLPSPYLCSGPPPTSLPRIMPHLLLHPYLSSCCLQPKPFSTHLPGPRKHHLLHETSLDFSPFLWVPLKFRIGATQSTPSSVLFCIVWDSTNLISPTVSVLFLCSLIVPARGWRHCRCIYFSINSRVLWPIILSRRYFKGWDLSDGSPLLHSSDAPPH